MGDGWWGDSQMRNTGHFSHLRQNSKTVIVFWRVNCDSMIVSDTNVEWAITLRICSGGVAARDWGGVLVDCSAFGNPAFVTAYG